MKPAREEIVGYLKSLRDQIITGFESLETSEKKFERETWDYEKGSGGGEMSVLRGDVFEKAAVNWSGVEGSSFPGDESSGPFYATGVSVITHMKNPKAPTIHFNIRYIESDKGSWFGGGYDLTPMGFPFEEDTKYFHSIAKNSLDAVDETLYPKFSQAAKEYFFIPHYNCERGVGGIFFDHYNTDDFEKDCKMWTSIGNSFLESILPIYKKRIEMPYTEEDRTTQLYKRARYVEFNLLYDRGTQFGFRSGGNPKAILCSMPPLAAW